MNLQQAMHLIVVDLETVGLKPGCIITEIGASTYILQPNEVPENRSVRFHFSEYIDYTASKKAGFKADKGTMKWWAEQLGIPYTPKDLDAVFASKWRNPKSIKRSIQSFSDFYDSVVKEAGGKDNVKLVANDLDFDKVILEHYYSATNTPIPWHYRDWLSLPTFVWLTEILTGVNVKEDIRKHWRTQHTGIDDARQEVAMLDKGFKLLADCKADKVDNNPEEGDW